MATQADMFLDELIRRELALAGGVPEGATQRNLPLNVPKGSKLPIPAPTVQPELPLSHPTDNLGRPLPAGQQNLKLYAQRPPIAPPSLPEPFQRSLPGIGQVPGHSQIPTVYGDAVQINRVPPAPGQGNLPLADRVSSGMSASKPIPELPPTKAVDPLAKGMASSKPIPESAKGIKGLDMSDTKSPFSRTAYRNALTKEADAVKLAEGMSSIGRAKPGEEFGRALTMGEKALEKLTKFAETPAGNKVLKALTIFERNPAAAKALDVGGRVAFGLDLLLTSGNDAEGAALEQEKVTREIKGETSRQQALKDAAASKLESGIVSVPFVNSTTDARDEAASAAVKATGDKPANAAPKEPVSKELGGKTIGWLPPEENGDRTVQTFGNVKIVPMPDGSREVRIYDAPQVSASKAVQNIVAPEKRSDPFDLGTELRKLDGYEAEEKVSQAILLQGNIEVKKSEIERRIRKAAEARSGLTAATQAVQVNNELDAQFMGKTLRPGQVSHETLVAQQQFTTATEVSERLYKSMIESDPEYAALKAGGDSLIKLATIGAGSDIKMRDRKEKQDEARSRIPPEALANYRAVRGTVQSDNNDLDAILKLPANDPVSKAFLYATKADLPNLLAHPDPNIRQKAVQWANNIEKMKHGRPINDPNPEHMRTLAKIASDPDAWLKANNPKLAEAIAKNNQTDPSYQGLGKSEQSQINITQRANAIKSTMENMALAKASDVATWPTVMPDSPLGKVVAALKKDSKSGDKAPLDMVIEQYMEASIDNADGTPMTAEQKQKTLEAHAQATVQKIGEVESMVAPDSAVLSASLMETVKLKSQRKTILQRIRKQAGETLTSAIQYNPFVMAAEAGQSLEKYVNSTPPE